MDKEKIWDVLTVGDSVKTQIHDNIEWIPNAVVNLYPHTQEIELIFDDRYQNMVVLVGDALTISYLKDDTQYLIEAWITGIRVETEKIMTLKIVSMKQTVNLRKEERYSVNYSANITSLEKPEVVFGIVTSISGEGLGFVAREHFEIGERVSILVYLPSNKFKVRAEIVRFAQLPKGIEYGVRFILRDDDEVNTLYEILKEIKEREDRLSHIVGF